jgi:rubrerythrin
MPDFATAFTVKASEKTLTHNELIRAIRLSMADEFEAIQVYTQLAESINHPLAQAVLLDIANEERVHAGEFLRLLYILDPDENSLYQEGAGEVDAQAAKLGIKSPAGQKETTIGSMKE